MPEATAQSIRIALDISCTAEVPITGIGYAAIYQLRALFARSDPRFTFSFFAAGARGGLQTLRRELGAELPVAFFPYARLAKYYAWTRLGWPPLEYFTGPARIAHNFSHQTPVASKAIKVVTIHDLSVFRHPETHTPRMVHVQSTLLRDCAKRADCIVSVSHDCKREICAVLGVSDDRVHVIHNGVNVAEFDEPLDDQRLAALRKQNGIRGEYIIHLGTIEPRKNLSRLMDAYRALHQRRRDLPQLLFVGAVGWSASHIMEEISAMGTDVIRPGYLSRNDVVLLMRGARASIYPSLYEGFGLPVLESMAARTPVITSSSSSLPEVAGDTALYVDPLDTDSIIHALEDLLDHPQAAAARAQLGRARAESLSWDASAVQLASLYASLAN